MNLDTKDVQVGSIVRKEENSDTAYKVEKIENDIVTLKDKDGNETTTSSSSLYAASEEQVKVSLKIQRYKQGRIIVKI